MDSKKLKILFISSEVEGFSKTGGLADVAKALPLELRNMGHEVVIITPFYRTLEHRETAHQVHQLHLKTDNARPDIPFSVQALSLDGIKVLAIDNAHYFDRAGLYGEENNAYADNGERFAFFGLAALLTAIAEDFSPDIVHCNDWHTGLVPYLLKARFHNNNHFIDTKTVLTSHNSAYQGIFEKSQLNLIPEVSSCMDERVLEGYSYINFLKVGVIYADKINTVSPNYASELLTTLGSHGMSDHFIERIHDFEGILNGCDYNDWSPETDKLIPYHFDSNDLSGKEKCKEALQKEVGLSVNDTPIFGMVCRLTDQKGFGLIIPILESFLRHNVQLVIVGSGDPAITGHLTALAAHYSDNFKFINGYSNELSHLIEAGSDFFLMPSIFEPCGLNQLYSLAYGTLPIVRAVGGLKDTVIDYDQDPDNANGFMFYEPNANELLNILRRALLLYIEHPEEMLRVKTQAMRSHFYWSDSAKHYERLYHSALHIRPQWS
ncbi:glycogen synthase GlgA [Psychromonas sp. 14N.309.X.WAT.B.A12]|uniref:glycogen synthase GlgA n=1 Tax=Psychromonas sp. 14N.309.X.WAT.B.A12 TaxID=2998322 RepID=UPI0025B1C9DA|nr:glycogen synthase GlgA [Psychromonas sp. 14N.309.X.WAT.B.A12]MDN2662816.1 glycogen synthase GlgA [Psychromonas sp. 14N.309.X.WAT.B.A12]